MELKKHTEEAGSKVAAVLQRAEEQGHMIESLHTSVSLYIFLVFVNCNAFKCGPDFPIYYTLLFFFVIFLHFFSNFVIVIIHASMFVLIIPTSCRLQCIRGCMRRSTVFIYLIPILQTLLQVPELFICCLFLWIFFYTISSTSNCKCG